MKRILLLLIALAPLTGLATHAFSQTDYVRDWLILGTFPHADDATRLSYDYLGPDASVSPQGGELSAGHRWRLYHSPKEFIDFLWGELPFEAREHCAVYAAFFVNSPNDQKTQLLVGSDDGITISCNRQQVHFNDVSRGLQLDDDTVTVQLKTGWNTLLLKIVNSEGGYGASARFADGEGLVLSAVNPFSPPRPLSPPSLSFIPKELDLHFALTQDNRFKAALELSLVNEGSSVAKDIVMTLSSGDQTVSRTVIPGIEGGEVLRGHQEIAFQDLVEIARKKMPVRLRLQYGGKDTAYVCDFSGKVLRNFFEPWELEGWIQERADERSVRLTRTIVVPAELSGLALRLAVDIGEKWGSLLVNGDPMLARFSGDSGELTLTSKARTGDTLRVELIVTSEKPLQGRALGSSTIRPRNDPLERYLYDVRFATEIYHADLGDQSAVLSQLFGLLQSHRFEQADEVLKPVNEKIASLAPEAKKLSLSLIGNAHIDMAWLWRVPETMEVTRATFQAALDNLKAYPDFHFSHGQAQSYFWIEQQHPDMFREIQKYVREGRWEIIGGTWVESDANLPSGESLVRQYLYGKRYFKKKFGVDVRHGFFPDTFGHPASLPQILNRSEIETYTFFRPWEDERMFRWESPDGSRVFAHHPSNWYGTWSDIPDTLWTAAFQTRQKFAASDAIQFFGVGDHGGGPTRRQIEKIELLGGLQLYPDTRMSTFSSYYGLLTPREQNTAVQRGELNPVFEGCYTSQATIKLNNRKAEALLPTAEMVSTIATRYGYDYPSREMEEAWHLVLFNQFHDLLCGSGIHEIYLDADQWYAQAFERADRVLQAALKTIALNITTTSRTKGTPLIVFNPMNWRRTEPIELGWKSEPERVPRVLDDRGRERPVQIIRASSDSVWFQFIPTDVPSIGYKTYWITTGKGRSRSLSGDLTLESRYFKVEIDRKSGSVSRIYDKRRKQEMLATGALANQLLIQEDDAPMSAWVIGLRGAPRSLEAPTSVKVVESGPVRKVVQTEYRFEGSSFTQDVILYADLPRIDFRTTVDWHHRKRVLKVAFPLNIQDGRATFEIPYGSIERPADGQEVVAQKWVDLSAAGYGVSLLNDSKYGFDVKGNVIRMTALRSPTDPDPKADEGRHEFSYALYPHAGSWEEGRTVLRGYEFNTPMVTQLTDQHHGVLPATYSFIETDDPNVVLSTLKKCEDDGSFILRFYETVGRGGATRLKFWQPVVGAAETNLIEWDENPIVDVAPGAGVLNVRLKPYEIKTLKLSLGKEQ
jgi:alpha-mannosidase